MLKVGQKATHFMQSHKVGTIVQILTENAHNYMTIGGTTQSDIFVVIKYSESDIQKFKSGDVIRIYD